MTTKWADGFEDDAAANLGADYTVVGSFTIGTGRRSATSCLVHSNSAAANITRTIGGTEATVLQSLSYLVTTLAVPTSDRSIMRFQEGSTVHVSISIIGSGAIEVHRGNRTTLLGTSAAVVTGNSWYWFQVKVVVHDSAGVVEVRDSSGSVLLNLTSQDTRNGGTGYVDTVSIGHTGGNGMTSNQYDDWHVWDSTGSICNTFTNDTRVDHKLPDGAGNSAQFTPSTGSNYACVDEANWNTTDYVESSTAGHIDTYTFGDIGHSPPSIYAVLITAVAQKDDAGARSLKMTARRSGTNYSGSSNTLNQGSYSRSVDVRETDPSTSAAWTQSGVNAGEYGFENV